MLGLRKKMFTVIIDEDTYMQFLSNLVIRKKKKILDPNPTIYNLAGRTLRTPAVSPE